MSMKIVKYPQGLFFISWSDGTVLDYEKWMPGEPSKGNEKCGMMFAFNGRYRKKRGHCHVHWYCFCIKILHFALHITSKQCFIFLTLFRNVSLI